MLQELNFDRTDDLGVPLLEENEIETEGSNSSEHGDTGSATYSETSNKA